MGQATEIERQFLLGDSPELQRILSEANPIPIRQGYLSWEAEREVRMREIGGSCFLTCKVGKGLSRLETEVSLSRDQFEELWPLTEGARIEKTRFRIELHGFLLEVDQYQGSLAGLFSVEVEFRSIAESEAFTVPAWFGTEVTLDERFKNKNLAISGFPDRGTAPEGLFS